MKHSIIKIVAIASNFATFVIIVDALPINEASVFLLALSFVSITVPILDFGYSRYAFAKIAHGLRPTIALSRVLSRIVTCSPAAIIASIIFSIANDISLQLLIACLFFGVAPLPTTIFRYFFILNEKHATSVIIEAWQPLAFLILSISTIIIKDKPPTLENITLIYCSSHLASFLLVLTTTPQISIKKLPRRILLFRSSLRTLKSYASTISISLEQLTFSLWLFMPVIFYGYLGNSAAIIEMSVLQKMLSLVVAVYSIYSVKKMSLMAKGHFCYWGNKYTIIAIAAIYFAGVALEKINDLLSKSYLSSDFMQITESILSHKISTPLLFISLFLFLHIQANLLYERRIKWRFYNSVTLVVLQAALAPLAYFRLLDEVSVILLSLSIIIITFLTLRLTKKNVLHE
ncbi:hypothetical protein KBW71_24630 [Hydrogenophaga aromaticivorans]|uniref:hypothetical protein n=1 Tax=Hydrogenophaga aromaticivorans TaxID=2610898 RepID=UPI001B35DC49|nr:hypothetical protein [Hydrogenophaga aromaticivorans]MBQ0921631.1 hypothetical protein [Hydrogenophaga aromaticivorans]